MENRFREVDGWLRGRRNVVCKREWLEACITWLIQEEVCFKISSVYV